MECNYSGFVLYQQIGLNYLFHPVIFIYLQECLNEAQAFSGAVLKLLLTVHSKASSYVFSIPALTEIDDNVLLMVRVHILYT